MPQQTLLGLDNFKIMAMGSRNIQRIYMGGELKTAAYISNLRYHPDIRHGIRLLKGIQEMENLAAGPAIDFHYAAFIDNDSYTKNIFTSNRPRMPVVHDMGLLNTFSIPIRKIPANTKPGKRFEVVRGDEKLMPQILSFLKNEGMRSDFFPDLDSYAPSLLQAESFFAIFDRGNLAGVCSLPEMRDKQYIMEGYSRTFGILRFPLNAYFALRKIHSIPRKGEEIKLAFIGFPVVKNDNPEIFRVLLSHVYNYLSGSEKHYLSLSLHERSPLIKSLSHFPKINYTSRLFMVKLKNDTFTEDSIFADKSLRYKSVPFIDLLRL
jgi:hypothetical protein